MRRIGLQEELATIGDRAAALKICGDGAADIGRQRHDRWLPSLALNTEMARSPVEIMELEGRDFLCAQAQPGEKRQYRIIAAARCVALRTTLQYLLTLPG